MEEIKISTVLCPVDYSENSDFGLEYALHMAAAFDAELLLLHAVEVPFLPSYGMAGMADMPMPVEDLEKAAADHMTKVVERCAARYPKVHGEVRTGTPFLEIIAYAREQEADLIIMGTHGRTGLSHMLIGSVAEKVVRKAPCPVLTVKHPKHNFEMP